MLSWVFQGPCSAHAQRSIILGPGSTRCNRRQAYNFGNGVHSSPALDESEQQPNLVLCHLRPSPVLPGKLMYFQVFFFHSCQELSFLVKWHLFSACPSFKLGFHRLTLFSASGLRSAASVGFFFPSLLLSLYFGLCFSYCSIAVKKDTMSKSALLKETFNGKIAYSFRGLVHYQWGGGMGVYRQSWCGRCG